MSAQPFAVGQRVATGVGADELRGHVVAFDRFDDGVQGVWVRIEGIQTHRGEPISILLPLAEVVGDGGVTV